MTADQPGAGLLIAQIVISRELAADDVLDHVTAQTADGDPLDLAEALGMLRLAEHTLIDNAMGRDE